MFLGDKKSVKDIKASTTCFQSVSAFCGCYQVFYTICISWLGQSRFKPAVTCLMVLVGLRTATETCRLMC